MLERIFYTRNVWVKVESARKMSEIAKNKKIDHTCCMVVIAFSYLTCAFLMVCGDTCMSTCLVYCYYFLLQGSDG